MKSTSLTLALSAVLSTANAYWSGFNVQATLGNGACKSQADWERDFNTMKSLPGAFTSMRVYASSDCDTLANAVPAAIKTGGTILVGVWTENAAHFAAEKGALLKAVQQYGFGWIVAVSVGSEVLYRGEASASTLAHQIYDVRGMLSTVPGYTTAVGVGHVDTWTAWVDSANTAVITACDFIGTDGYPYFENTKENGVDQGYNLFWDSVQKVRDAVSKTGSGAWVWVAESGWPTVGPTENKAIPSVANAQQYWSTVACSAFKSGHTFWYSLQDFAANPSFGVVDANYKPIYNLAC
ncbi:probable glucan 1,3-beta-glucosidase precursor [Rhynchosporium agropyri]|uniref:Probable glucan endo-1,3-beta-glucosidase eglC n=2 Tax=Rhynchosporium TaxID=38037 RepID=A0A1E1KVY1_9HELO|nr:probable glucan 1,3-beta-glucosidase precursor [Rhynchosporium agropyri]CZT12176.1 probable glucan 1,3-beta-glucosidase precursor [Rhynchosporium commune]